MKFFGWLYLALMLTVQLIGWIGYGRSAATGALLVIALPSSLLSGAAFFGFFYWHRSWVFLPAAALALVQIDVSCSSRWVPSSALLRHAMSQLLEKEVAGSSWESYFAGMALLLGMFVTAAAAAYGTAEAYRLTTGCTDRGGLTFFRDLARSLAQWDQKVTGGKGN